MALLPDVFKPNDIKGDMLLDDGLYVLEITKSSMKDTKNKKGKYLSLSMKVTRAVDEADLGFYIFVNLNLVNPNPMAVSIAEREFKQLCEAVGVEDEIEDSDEIHGIPFCAQIATCSGGEDYPDSNCIKKYMPESEFDDALEGEDVG